MNKKVIVMRPDYNGQCFRTCLRFMYLNDTCYLNNHAFHVYKPSTKHAASSLFLFTLETNAGTTIFIFNGKLAIRWF